ncbi:MAG: DsbE family thiol:disulfide interchange protein [Rhodobacterales bacterium]|nr:MAG: DsbE family thiol:disulfide interchange protein [Rhodobacterales bacterium]PIE12584.1 MAG: DsbE family thiol:disulfide interchange protein [Rhodobacterales bacterium]
MFLPPLVFALLAGLFLWSMGREDVDALPSTREGGPVPALELTELGGSAPFSEADLADGGVVLVNFWASWCGPCRAEHPQLLELAQSGVEIYGVNYKDDPAKALKFLEELGNPYARLGADASGRNGLQWGLYGVPETYVINGKGEVVKRFAGPITRSVLTAIIQPAIEAARGE